MVALYFMYYNFGRVHQGLYFFKYQRLGADEKFGDSERILKQAQMVNNALSRLGME